MDFNLTDEQRMWRDSVRTFCERMVKPRARHVDETGEFNWEAVSMMGPLGLLGLNVPEEFGGSGVDAVSAAIAIEELGRACGSTALSIAAHNGLGCGALSLFGTTAQKEKWLRPLASGAGHLASLALTEPGAGSDLAGGVKTRARLDREQWVIQGSKMWVTNASVADVIVTLVRTDPAGGTRSMSMIIVPTHAPGLTIAAPEKKMGLHGSPTHAVTYDEVRVPQENLLGESGRGLAQAAFEEAMKYAKDRSAFGRPIAEFEAIQWMLADAATEIEAARLMVYRAAWLKQGAQPFALQAAMGKLLATEVAERVCRNAIQIHGGYGYSSEYPVERIYRDARLMTIGEGTSEVQRMVIARHILANA
jgi:alkylation response protein AidB-like acyl-CoA dehydrogenase